MSPGVDWASERMFGRRPGEETANGLIEAATLWWQDPDAAASALVGWERYQENPYRWLGSVAPDLAVEALTLGAGSAILGVTRSPRHLVLQLADPPLDEAASVVGHLDDVFSGRALPDLELQRRGEPEWAAADDIVSHRAEPFESPETWVRDLNGDGLEVPGRDLNCIDCSRSVEANWRGQDAVAAPLADTVQRGTTADRIEDWIDGRLTPTTLEEVGRRLEELGPGSSAMITSRWGSGGAHAYNAVNDGGVVKWVDAQLGQVSPWPPPYADAVDATLAIVIDAAGTPR